MKPEAALALYMRKKKEWNRLREHRATISHEMDVLIIEMAELTPNLPKPGASDQ